MRTLAKFGSANDYSEAYFDESFGKLGLPEGNSTLNPFTYGGGVQKRDYDYKLNKLKELNKSAGDRIQKELATDSNETATSTTFSSTSGSIPTLIPLWLSPDIINLSQKETPVQAILGKVPVKGKFHNWNSVTYPSTYTRFRPEDASMVEHDDTYSMSTVEMKYLYSVGRVTGPMQVHTQGYINAERNEIMLKTQALLHKLEEEILNGSTSDDSNGFNGIGTAISTNSETLSDSIAVSDVRTAVLRAKQGAESWGEVTSGGNPNLIITNLQTYDDLKVLLMPYLRYNDSTSIAWGITTFSFDGIPVLASKFMTTTSGSKELYAIDTNYVKLGVALDVTFERLAKTNDSNKFMIKWYGALLVLKETACADIVSIT